MGCPDDLKYTETHEWVKQDGNVVTVGITDYAQEELTDIVFVELPEIGKEVSQKGTLCIVESVKAASDIYAAVSGKVIEVNNTLTDAPEKVNSDPYGEGWMCKIEMSDSSELDSLLTSENYQMQIS